MNLKYPPYLYVFSSALLCVSLLGGCDDSEERAQPTASSGEAVTGGVAPSGGDSGGELGERSGGESGGDPGGDSGGESGGDSAGDAVWVTKPPAAAGEGLGGEEIIWVNTDLTGLGLIDPHEAPSDPPPIGEAPCAYQAPIFSLEHPRARGGVGGSERDRSADGVAGDVWSTRAERPEAYHLPPASVAHLEPTHRAEEQTDQRSREKPDLEGVVLPVHVNDMPLFERAREWEQPRCYELGPFDERSFEVNEGGTLLDEEGAYEMYVRLIRATLWREVDQRIGHRTVVGLRGAYPGSLRWHHNAPNQFNDTIVLLWRDAEGAHVREYPVNTDTGEYDFGADNSSSLRPNRHYPYINGWHRDYHALQIDLPGYPVRDDTNNNGHWDSDRNGWLEGPEAGQDYDRLGTAHNIHAGDIDAPLQDSLIDIASAGCQVIPGMENWLSFLGYAWTGLGDEVDYFLIDVRDISPRFWSACGESDGSHVCPFMVSSFPYQHQSETNTSQGRWHDVYNCSDADESGAERVYVLNLPESGTLRLTLSDEGEGADPDLHLLEGDDPRACRARGHRDIESWTPAGRYIVIVDTWVNASGEELPGGYTLNIDWSPDR